MLGIIAIAAVATLMICIIVMMVDLLVEVIKSRRRWDVGTCTMVVMISSLLILIATLAIQFLVCRLGI